MLELNLIKGMLLLLLFTIYCSCCVIAVVVVAVVVTVVTVVAVARYHYCCSHRREICSGCGGNGRLCFDNDCDN
jgi:hypothetical protein